MLTHVSDLLDRIRRELDDRAASLKPAVDESARLQRAVEALDGAMSPAVATRVRSASAGPRAAQGKAPRRRSAASRKSSRRAAPGQTQLRVIEELRNAPGSSSTAVAQALGISANAAAATISRLVKQARVVRLETGGYAPADAPTPVQEPGSGAAQAP